MIYSFKNQNPFLNVPLTKILFQDKIISVYTESLFLLTVLLKKIICPSNNKNNSKIHDLKY